MTNRLKQLLRIPIGWLRAARRVIRARKARLAIAELQSHESPSMRAIAMALSESLANSLSPEERTMVESIEKRRSSLLGSSMEIDVIDYGAGTRKSKRTAEEMERGVASTAQVSQICRASKPARWAIILFKLIRKLKPVSCVELGSCVGISASYQAAALTINGEGTLRTLEGSPEIAKIAEETFAELNLSNAEVITGPFQVTLQNTLELSAPIDFYFNDGHHDHDAVIRYFNEAIPFLSDHAVIVFDDISWSAGMKKAWSEIESDERVAATIDLGAVGIAVMGTRTSHESNLRILL